MAEKKIKVAQIIGHAANGGVESFVLNYYNKINLEEFSFDFYVDGESKLINVKNLKDSDSKIVIIPSIKRIFKLIIFLIKRFKEEKYDIVHANLNSLNIIPLFCAYLAGVKVRISHSHSTANKQEGSGRYLMKNTLKLFSHLFATDYFACSIEAGRWLFGNNFCKKHNIIVIKNAIDLSKFFYNLKGRKEIRSLYNIEDYIFLIGMVGRLEDQKNPFFGLSVFYEYHKINKQSKLMLVGNGRLKEKLLEKVESLNLKDSVLFAGAVCDANLYYSAFDFFLFPSIYEGLGISLIEAQASGLNCLCSNFIPSEAVLLQNVIKVNLEKGAKYWADLIENFGKSDRNSCRELLINSDYNIEVSGSTLENLYKSFVSRSN